MHAARLNMPQRHVNLQSVKQQCQAFCCTGAETHVIMTLELVPIRANQVEQGTHTRQGRQHAWRSSGLLLGAASKLHTQSTCRFKTPLTCSQASTGGK